MGLFDDLPKYGGTFTRRFDQNPFIDGVMNRFPRSEYLAEGACAALAIDWLEFKIQNLNNDLPYDDERLQENGLINSIIQIQAYLRLRDVALSQFISNFGVERQNKQKSYVDFINTLGTGIHVIQLKYQNPDGTNGNHVAVCMGYIKNGKLNIELFDAARGDAKFSLDDQNSLRAKEWLTAYFNSYESRGCTFNISSFSLQWNNSFSRVAQMCKETNDIMLARIAENPNGFWSNSAAAAQQSSSATATYTPRH